jgi:hypothetical protein
MDIENINNNNNSQQNFKYTAIIVEPRKHKALEFVLNNACDCLSPEWKIILFHGKNNIEYATKIVERLNVIFNNRIFLINLNVDNLNQTTYSNLFINKNTIYDHITSDIFLIFQTDSVIIKQNAHLIHDYFNYDYVGSPWLITEYEPTKICNYIGNGGFSLRNKNKMLEIIDKIPYNNHNNVHFEDLYFSTNYDNILVRKPSYETASKFCVGEVFNETPFSCHRYWPHDYYKDDLHQHHYYRYLNERYPECKLLMSLQFEENE